MLIALIVTILVAPPLLVLAWLTARNSVPR